LIPKQVSNPSLQKHYAIVQAIALDEPKPNEVVDELCKNDYDCHLALE
jgi:hypothetical protein